MCKYSQQISKVNLMPAKFNIMKKYNMQLAALMKLDNIITKLMFDVRFQYRYNMHSIFVQHSPAPMTGVAQPLIQPYHATVTIAVVFNRKEIDCHFYPIRIQY